MGNQFPYFYFEELFSRHAKIIKSSMFPQLRMINKLSLDSNTLLQVHSTTLNKKLRTVKPVGKELVNF